MHVALKVQGQPDFYPDYADVAAPPPPGTVVTIGSQVFTVRALRLTGAVYPHPGGGDEMIWHYTAELIE